MGRGKKPRIKQHNEKRLVSTRPLVERTVTEQMTCKFRVFENKICAPDFLSASRNFQSEPRLLHQHVNRLSIWTDPVHILTLYLNKHGHYINLAVLQEDRTRHSSNTDHAIITGGLCVCLTVYQLYVTATGGLCV